MKDNLIQRNAYLQGGGKGGANVAGNNTSVGQRQGSHGQNTLNSTSAMNNMGQQSGKIQVPHNNLSLISNASPYHHVITNNENGSYLSRKQTQPSNNNTATTLTPQESTLKSSSVIATVNSAKPYMVQGNHHSKQSQFTGQPNNHPRIKNQGSIFGQIANAAGPSNGQIGYAGRHSELLTKSIKKQMTQQKQLQGRSSAQMQSTTNGPDEQYVKRKTMKEKRSKRQEGLRKERQHTSLTGHAKSSDSSNQNHKRVQSSSLGPTGSQKEDGDIISEKDAIIESSPKKQKNQKELNNEPDNEEEEAMNIIGKLEEEIRERKITKEKLKVTKVPKLVLGYNHDAKVYFGDHYEYIRFLGTGSFGFVVAGYPLDSKQVFALKIVDKKSNYSTNALQREAEIFEELSEHDNVIKYDHIKEFQNYIIMAIEFAAGGTVAELRKRVKRLGDEDCAKLIKSILLGLKHIQKNNYVHRDIKPSNIVLKSPDDYGSVKLVDFGLAVKYQTRQGIDENCGTLVYQAPEQMAGGQLYGKSVDIWAVGFIMFELLNGKHPLWARHETVETYKKKVMNFQGLKYSQYFSPLARNLLEKLCHPKPSLRYTVEQALQHPWITRDFKSDIPRTFYENTVFLDEIDGKLRKVFNAVYFLMMVKNPDSISNKFEGNKKSIQTSGPINGQVAQTIEQTNEASNLADHMSQSHLTESSPLKTCSTSSRVGRYQSDLGMIQRHGSSIVQKQQKQHSSSTLSNYTKNKSADGKHLQKRQTANAINIAKMQKDGKHNVAKLFIKKSEVRLADHVSKDKQSSASTSSKIDQKRKSSQRGFNKIVTPARKGSLERSAGKNNQAEQQAPTQSEIIRQTTPHFISQKQSQVAERTPHAFERVVQEQDQDQDYGHSSIHREQLNMDEFLLGNNANGVNSFSDINDSIFGGHSQMVNVSDEMGLKQRRFDQNDCRLTLHLNIEKSNKKKSQGQNQQENQSFTNNIGRQVVKIHNSDQKVIAGKNINTTKIQEKGALDKLVAQSKVDNMLSTGRRSQMLYQRTYKELNGSNLQNSQSDMSQNKIKSQIIHYRNSNMNQESQMQLQVKSIQDSQRKSLESWRESQENFEDLEVSPTPGKLRGGNMIQDSPDKLKQTNSMKIQNQDGHQRYLKLKKISTKQSIDSIEKTVGNLSQGLMKQGSIKISQDYPINLKPSLIKPIAVSPLNTSQKSIHSSKPPLPGVRISTSPTRHRAKISSSSQSRHSNSVDKQPSQLWQRQESGGDMGIGRLDELVKTPIVHEGKTIRQKSNQAKFSMTDKKIHDLTVAEKRRRQDQDRRKESNKFSKEDERLELSNQIDKSSVKNEVNSKDDQEKVIPRSRNGLRRMHKSSGATHQQRKSEVAQNLSYKFGQDPHNEFKSQEPFSKSQQSLSSSSLQDNDDYNIQLFQQDNGIVKRKKTNQNSNQDQQTDRFQNQKSIEIRPSKELPFRKGSRKPIDMNRGTSISGGQKKEKSTGNKSGFRTTKKITHKKNSKNQLIVIGSSNQRDNFDSNKLPIGVIEESNVDEEKGTVEQTNDGSLGGRLFNPSTDDLGFSSKPVKKINTESIQKRLSKEIPLTSTFSEFEKRSKLNKNIDQDSKNRKSYQLNESLPYISQNRSSMSSMTCIQPSIQQILKKNSSEDVTHQEIQLTETFVKHFQSNKMMMDQVNSSQIAAASTTINHYDRSNNTPHTQSLLSKQSRNSHSKSNRDKISQQDNGNKNTNSSAIPGDPINILNFQDQYNKDVDMPLIRNKNKTIQKILKKIPAGANAPDQVQRQESRYDGDKKHQGQSFQHPARSNTPLIVKQKLVVPAEARVAVNGLEVIKHANMNANSQQYLMSQSQGKISEINNQKIQNIIHGLQRFQNIDKKNNDGTQQIKYQNFQTPQKQSKVGSVKLNTPKDKDQYMRGHLKQLVVTSTQNHIQQKQEFCIDNGKIYQNPKVITTSNQMSGNNKQMRSPLLNGNNNAYIDNPILKNNQITDQKLLDEANKIIAQRGMTSQSLHSINSRQHRLKQLQPSQQNVAFPPGKRLQSSQPYLGHPKNSSAPRESTSNNMVSNRDDHFSPFETFLLNLLQKSSDNVPAQNVNRPVPVVNDQGGAQTKLIPQNIQKLQQFQIGAKLSAEQLYQKHRLERASLPTTVHGSISGGPYPSTSMTHKVILAPHIHSQKANQKVLASIPAQHYTAKDKKSQYSAAAAKQVVDSVVPIGGPKGLQETI